MADNIPDHCDKVLFAEDVVRYFLSEILNVSYQPSKASPFREFIYESFNDTVKTAVLVIYHRIIICRAAIGLAEGEVNEAGFVTYAKRLRRTFFRSGFDARSFLLYCVHLGIAVSQLVSSIGLQNAGDLAVKNIIRAVKKHDMMCGGWSTLNITAESLNSIEIYANVHSPDMVDPDFDEYDDSTDDADSDDGNNNNYDADLAENDVAIKFDELNVGVVVGEPETEPIPELINKEEIQLEEPQVSNNGDFAAKSSKDINSADFAGSCSTSCDDENKQTPHFGTPVKNFLAPQAENNIPLQKKRSPKRDHRGLIIQPVMPACDTNVPSTSYSTESNSSAQTLISNSETVQMKEDSSFDKHKSNTSYEAKQLKDNSSQFDKSESNCSRITEQLTEDSSTVDNSEFDSSCKTEQLKDGGQSSETNDFNISKKSKFN